MKELEETGIETLWYWKEVDRQDRTEQSTQALTGARATPWSRDGLFSKWCWNHGSTFCKENKFPSKPHTEINSEWIIDLTVKHKTIKL